MKQIFIQSDKCGTCQKAAKWQKANEIDVEVRDIITASPTAEELSDWIAKSDIPATEFFNTSGLCYKKLFDDKILVADNL